MGYSLHIIDAQTNKTVELSKKHHLHGSIAQLGGSSHLWMDVTYNYAKYFRKVLDDSLYSLDGMTMEKSIPILYRAVHTLEGDPAEDYWAPTEGNAKQALAQLLELAILAPPDATWEVT